MTAAKIADYRAHNSGMLGMSANIKNRASVPYLQEYFRISSKVEAIRCLHCALVKRGHLFRDARS